MHTGFKDANIMCNISLIINGYLNQMYKYIANIQCMKLLIEIIIQP